MGVSEDTVTDVEIYPYVDWDPGPGQDPVMLPVVTRASGVYSAAGSALGVRYLLEVTGGRVEHPPIGELRVGGTYVGRMRVDDGGSVTSPPLTCTGADDVSQSFTAFLGTVGSGSAVSPSSVSPAT